MTPKDKAYSLVDQYVGFKLDPYDDPEMTVKKGTAKRHALIAVDEIIKYVLPRYQDFTFALYWEDVKKEIEKI